MGITILSIGPGIYPNVALPALLPSLGCQSGVYVCVVFYHGRSKQEVEVKQHSLKLLQQRISGSESAQMAEAVAATQAELQQAKAAAEAAKQKKADMIKAAKVTCPGQTSLKTNDCNSANLASS